MGDDFKPRLGRPGDRGKAAAGRYSARVRKAASRLAKPGAKRRFSGARIGRGSAAARMASFRARRLPAFRMRRVIVKVHIARAGKGIGKAAFRAHVKYIQRDGVDREGRGGELYDRAGERLDDRAFLERGADDRHQFRIILSPEDADALEELKANTRAFMARVERDVGTRLDWVAVDHWNTGHPHTHVVIRGKDSLGKDLVIAREYLTQGMRALAQEIVTETLGPRRDLEIARSAQREVGQERFTGLDRRLSGITKEGVVEIARAKGPRERFDRSLAIGRLKHLEKLGLAEAAGPLRWRLASRWEETLKTMGRRGDIIREIAAAMGEAAPRRDIRLFDGADGRQRPVFGRVIAAGPGDELRDTRFLIIDGVDGHAWRADLGSSEPGALPPIGALVEAVPSRPAPRASDRTIARIAAVNRGVYSDALHAKGDPGASRAYREAHKRRLEALRRAGVVERLADGSWKIGEDFLERAMGFETGRAGGVKIVVKSWIALEAQIDRRAPTWLDMSDAEEFAARGFGAEAAAAKRARMAFLKREGLWSDAANGLDPVRLNMLGREELEAAATAEMKRSNRTQRMLQTGASFSGVYERPVDLAQGRFALVARAKEFALVPWRADLERLRGQTLTLKRRAAGIDWTPGVSRQIGR